MHFGLFGLHPISITMHMKIASQNQISWQRPISCLWNNKMLSPQSTHAAYGAFPPWPDGVLTRPTFSPTIDRRAKRQPARETGGQANPCVPSAPFNFLSLFHSILCGAARSDKPPHSLAHSSPLFPFVHPAQLCAPLFILQTAHHWRVPPPKSRCPTRTPSLRTLTRTQLCSCYGNERGRRRERKGDPSHATQ